MTRTIDDDEKVYVTVPLDVQTAARLISLSDNCGVEYPEMAAALLNDLLEDDVEYNVEVNESKPDGFALTVSGPKPH